MVLEDLMGSYHDESMTLMCASLLRPPNMKDGSDALKQGGPTFLKHELHVSSPETLTSKKKQSQYNDLMKICVQRAGIVYAL